MMSTGAGQGGQEVAVEECNAFRHSAAVGVGGGHFQRRRRQVDGPDGCIRQMAGQRYGDGPAACPHIGDCDSSRGVNAAGCFQGEVNEQFRLGPGYERPLVNQEVEAVELTMAHDIGKGFPPEPSFEQVHEAALLGRGDDVVAPGPRRGMPGWRPGRS